MSESDNSCAHNTEVAPLKEDDQDSIPLDDSRWSSLSRLSSQRGIQIWPFVFSRDTPPLRDALKNDPTYWGEAQSEQDATDWLQDISKNTHAFVWAVYSLPVASHVATDVTVSDSAYVFTGTVTVYVDRLNATKCHFGMSIREAFRREKIATQVVYLMLNYLFHLSTGTGGPGGLNTGSSSAVLLPVFELPMAEVFWETQSTNSISIHAAISWGFVEVRHFFSEGQVWREYVMTEQSWKAGKQYHMASRLSGIASQSLKNLEV
ncbi:hypothetical protein TREMEDRAFT_59655 [Tremella mesenterica DSM 1558]|uniref:uncharacterized protein n=1 Tax=Tremella mesenterica (strain ATCC 24925 / CBS 8224 / DSM 1558 / NBRC 9311 / NRRL Y-6157 / RJB 2259-6 / UBC 559-6) TaxID=578456 RepID=UPI0003F49A6C|nr:uncharacterized protein TREMEDRAFT_59655 [Tremella mesenterica DSM 1558]EIW73482.1 hypothetical protein TREMEDRAFT_59655 [Tremella mesenterica DSM 1558]